MRWPDLLYHRFSRWDFFWKFWIINNEKRYILSPNFTFSSASPLLCFHFLFVFNFQVVDPYFGCLRFLGCHHLWGYPEFLIQLHFWDGLYFCGNVYSYGFYAKKTYQDFLVNKRDEFWCDFPFRSHSLRCTWSFQRDGGVASKAGRWNWSLSAHSSFIHFVIYLYFWYFYQPLFFCFFDIFWAEFVFDK